MKDNESSMAVYTGDVGNIALWDVLGSLVHEVCLDQWRRG